MGFLINLRLNFKQAPKFKTMLSRGKRILKMISQKDEKKTDKKARCFKYDQTSKGFVKKLPLLGIK